MSDVIERLLSVEQEARRIIAQAEKDADEALERAREEGGRIESEGHAETRRQAEEVLSTAERSLREQKEEAIRQESERLPSADSIDAAELGKAVRFAVGVIAGAEGEGT